MLETIQPVKKRAPALTGKRKAQRVGTIPRGSVPIFIREQALDEILDYSESEICCEIGGFLLGGYFQHRGHYVEIHHFLAARNTHSEFSTLTFTHTTWAELNRQVRQQHPHSIVVGWHHTHPGFGIFLSHYDQFIHRNFFSQPWQVAMVVDPCQNEFGFFQNIDDQIVNCGFVCIPAG